jgi:trans-aconitate 2-methyltransferase
MTHADIWDPDAYLRLTHPRTRAVRDLLGNVEHRGPKLVIDLGCGPGNNTELIADRWPDARVIGIDSSPRMIEAARSREQPGRLEFRVGDVRAWEPDSAVDVVLASAVLHWIPDHLGLLPRLVDYLAPGGVLGFQVPGGGAPGSGSAMDVAEELIAAQWSDKLPDGLDPSMVHPVAEYLIALGDAGLQAEAWQTRYLFPLPGEGSLARYMAGSVLRSVLARLSPSDANLFLAQYAERLRDTHPAFVIGGRAVEVLDMQRTFAVGQRP